MGEKKLADPIGLKNSGMSSEIKQFISSTSYLLSRMFGVGIPPEDKIEVIVENIMGGDYPVLEPFKYREKGFENIEYLKEIIGKAGNLGERMITPIDISSSSKDLKNGIISFLHSSSCLRSANFRLKPMLKYKIERLVYEAPISLDSVASMCAALVAIEISRYITVVLYDRIEPLS